MSMQSAMSVAFWGVRGTVAAPGPGTVRYGGNTSCVELRCGEHRIILDAGTGLRVLGEHLEKTASPVDIDIFLSHSHIDHINGLPFFAPARSRANHIRLWAGHLQPPNRLETAIRQLMSPPLFPIEMKVLKADIQCRDFACGQVLKPRPDVTIETAALDHPDGATGYRIEHAGKSVAYITDTETREDRCVQNIVSLARDADLMIFDCTFTEAEIGSRAGWGHSTWQQGARLADKAGAKRFCMFHHDPDRNDDALDQLVKAAAAVRPGSMAAQEGLVIGL